jgi:hypothetical protein
MVKIRSIPLPFSWIPSYFFNFGSEDVGSEDVGSEDVGSEDVGSQDVGSETVREPTGGRCFYHLCVASEVVEDGYAGAPWDLIQTYNSAKEANHDAVRWVEAKHRKHGVKGTPLEDPEYHKEAGWQCVKVFSPPEIVEKIGIRFIAFTMEEPWES